MACLSDETLARFTEGKLDTVALGRVHTHLDRCPTCRRLVAGLASVDPQLHTQPAFEPSAVVGLQPGDRVGRYKISGYVGRGGQGTVYRAHDHDLSRDVAIKIMRFADPERQPQFLAEARALAELSHPNVVPVYDVGTVEGRVYLVLEYVRGRSVAAWLASSPSRSDILDTFDACANGLEAMHHRGLVHRDFKPSNVLVSEDGRILVTDLGLVHRVGPSTLVDSTAGSDSITKLVGTLAYMGPEQLRGEEATPATDQFSLGVALTEALTGESPYLGKTLAERYHAICTRRFAPTMAALPRRLRTVLERALRPEPDERYASLRELRDGLRPLAATPHYSNAAPIVGASTPAEVEFDFAMEVNRVAEHPRITKPFSEEAWDALDALGKKVDAAMDAGDMRLTMGGEPTFVSIDRLPMADEWNTAAVGPDQSGGLRIR